MALGGYPIQPSFFAVFNEFGGPCSQVMNAQVHRGERFYGSA
jgi:hypothetical protein